MGKSKKKESKPGLPADDGGEAELPPAEEAPVTKSKKKRSAEAAEMDKSDESKKKKSSKKAKKAQADDDSNDTPESAGDDAAEGADDAEAKPEKAKKKKTKGKSDQAAAAVDGETSDKPVALSLDEGARSVYISGLPFDFKRKDIEGIFEKVGAMVTYIHMPVFEDSRRCRGFATVTFTKSEYVGLALELDGSKLKGGRWLKVAPLDKSKLKKKKGKKSAAAEADEDEKPAPKKERKRRYTERPEGCNKVYVGNIPRDASESELRDLFNRCGTITHLSMPADKRTGKFAGSAFIEFEPNPEDEPTEKAYSLSGKVRIHANKLIIDYAPDATVCFRCKSKEHLSRDCPRRQVHNKKVRLDEE